MTAAIWENGKTKRKEINWGKRGSTVEVGKKRPGRKRMPRMVKYVCGALRGLVVERSRYEIATIKGAIEPFERTASDLL